MAGSGTYLDAILAAHRTRAAGDDRDVEVLRGAAADQPATRGFARALTSPGLSVIAEIKRRSPSKGSLAPDDLDPALLAKSYEIGGAACLSVLTDGPHFGGSADDLGRARAAVDLPVLRKDFTTDERDVCDARLMGADAVLLIAAALADADLSRFHALAKQLGLDVLVEVHDGAVSGVESTKGYIRARRIGVVAAGHTSVIMERAGLRMPLESFPLQALVSEPVKPVFPCVLMSNAVHAYISQSDKGELVIGAGTDQYVSYSQQGGLHITTHTLEAICELFPQFSRMRMLRSWGGVVDVTPDRSPIIGKTAVPGLYVNCGWGTGGFKATPGSGHVFAWTIAKGEPHPINAPFTLDRFRTGRLIDEAAAAAVAH